MHKVFLFFMIAVLAAFTVQAQGSDSARRAFGAKSLFKPATPLVKDTLSKKDSLNAVKKSATTISQEAIAKTDSVPKKKLHSAKGATIRSALVPGWAQFYNKEYWKIPIVLGALAVPTATYFFNNQWYKKTKFAYSAVYKAFDPIFERRDASDIPKMDPELLALYQKYGENNYQTFLSTMQQARNGYRRNRDFSLVWFFLLWGLNVVDATVFGHLKDFDISPDLSMRIRPEYNQIVRGPGLSVIFSIGDNGSRKQRSYSLKNY